VKITMCSMMARWSSSRPRGIRPGTSPSISSLPTTGNVLLSGDLYHYPEEMTFKKVPVTDPNREQTAKSREAIETFVKQNNAKLWIQHDYVGGTKRKIAPAFYD
jgi:N-acyl homoserine lactone hydrolase